jgi:pectinesterase
MADQTVNDKMRRITTILFLLASLQLCSQEKIVVDAEGKGDFKTIQAAINSLPDLAVTPRTIFIKKGTYSEKIFIEKKQHHF